MVNVTAYQTAHGVRYRVRYRKPDGSQTDKRGFRRKIDAEQWAAEHVTTAKARGSFIDPRDANVTVGALSSAWLAAKRTRVKPSYIDDLEASYSKWVAPSWGSVPVSSVSRPDVQRWVSSISRERSATVVLRAHGILAGILDDAVRDNRIPANPARGVELPRKIRKRHTYLTVEQLYTVASYSGWRHDIVLTLGLCGMRWGELVPLRVRDIDLERRRISISVSAPMVGGKPTPGDTKTHENRLIMFPSVLDDIMRDHCEGRDRDALLFVSPRRPLQMIREGGQASSGTGWFAKALKQAGVQEHMTLHDLRHTAASIMVQSGANIKAVQRQLGHASAAMTLDVYADLFDSDLDVLGERMSSIVLEKCGQKVGK